MPAKSHYTIEDIFKVLGPAKVRLKLLKQDNEMTRLDKIIMNFSAYKLVEDRHGWVSARVVERGKGKITLKAFRDLQNALKGLLPGLTKANLEEIVRETRRSMGKKLVNRNRWKDNSWGYNRQIEIRKSLLEVEDEEVRNNRLVNDTTTSAYQGSVRWRYRNSKPPEYFPKPDKWGNILNLEKYNEAVVRLAGEDYWTKRVVLYKTKEGRAGIGCLATYGHDKPTVLVRFCDLRPVYEEMVESRVHVKEMEKIKEGRFTTA